jgi:uncharacterized protein YoxC
MMISAAAQMGPDVSGTVIAANVAEIVIALAVVVLAGLGIFTVVSVRRLLGEIRRTAAMHLGPVADRTRVISDNLEFITHALRRDVEKLGASVEALTDRLHLASERMEERIEEFNALMEVVQGEAEEMFLETASTVRGVRQGARTITERAHDRPDRRGVPGTGTGSDGSAPLPDGREETELSVSEHEDGSSAD